MIKPMLAVPMHKGTITDWNDWMIEEKYDGVRLIVEVTGTTPLSNNTVTAWTRPRGSSKEMAQRTLPVHLVSELAQLPRGTYDGELLAGHTSTDVTRLDLEHERRMIIFDVLTMSDNVVGVNTRVTSYDARRKLLKLIFRKLDWFAHIAVAHAEQATSKRDVDLFVKRVWNAGGEGAVLKRKASTYQPGKRSPDWIKVKKCQHATMRVVGFEPSRGTVRFPGHPFAIVKLIDDDGNTTTVKTKDDHELEAFSKAAQKIEGTLDHVYRRHPAVGRQLVVEYQDRTRDGGYRHPRWDRWEDE